LILRAPFTGTVTDLSPDLQPGQWISPKDAVLDIGSGAEIDAYLGEDDLPRIQVGAAATFIPESSSGRRAATVTAIDRTAVKSLANPELAAPYGGGIPARFDSKAMVPDVAVYRVRLSLVDEAVAAPLRGQVHIHGDRRSLLGRALRAAAAVVIREWGA
jgi:putative peptide zinc metalloprotease protein